MSIKISELPQATSVNSSDIVPIVQGGATKQATAGMMNLDVYSTTEQRVGTWIDGKPLYRITIDCGNLPNKGTTKDVYFSPEIDTVTNISGIANSSTFALPFPTTYSAYMFDGVKIYCRLRKDLKCVQIRMEDGTLGSTDFNCFVAMEYTKTTDTATRSLNLTKSANTGELVGIGNRVELTEETKQDEEQVEKQVEQVMEQVENISAEPIETKTEGSGDTI